MGIYILNTHGRRDEVGKIKVRSAPLFLLLSISASVIAATPDDGPSFSDTANFINQKLMEFSPHGGSWRVEYNEYRSVTSQWGRELQSVSFSESNKTITLHIIVHRYAGRKGAWDESRTELALSAPLSKLDVFLDSNQRWADVDLKSVYPDINVVVSLRCADNTRCFTLESQKLEYCDDSGTSNSDDERLSKYYRNFCNGYDNDLVSAGIWMRQFPDEQPKKVLHALEHLIDLAKKASPQTRELF